MHNIKLTEFKTGLEPLMPSSHKTAQIYSTAHCKLILTLTIHTHVSGYPILGFPMVAFPTSALFYSG